MKDAARELKMLQPVYFFVGMVTAAVTVFLPPYLRGIGLSGKEVASVMSLAPAMQLGAPLLWAWLADKTRRHAAVLSLILSGGCLAFFPFVFARRPAVLMACYAAYALFWAGVTSTQDAVAIGQLRTNPKLAYGNMRAWGSVGFLSSAILVGGLLTLRGERSADGLVPLFGAVFMALAAFFSFRVHGPGEPAPRPKLADVGRLLREPVFRRLLLIAPLHWGAAAPYNQFFGLFARDHHLSPFRLGLAFATGVLAEVVVLVRFPRFRRWASLRTLMAVAFAGTLLRWLLVASIENPLALVLLQTLHGLTYGLFWATSIACLQATVAPALRATGQALFVMAMAGIGTFFGSLATGALYDATGSITPAFYGAALVEVLALVLLLRPRASLDVGPLVAVSSTVEVLGAQGSGQGA